MNMVEGVIYQLIKFFQPVGVKKDDQDTPSACAPYPIQRITHSKEAKNVCCPSGLASRQRLRIAKSGNIISKLARVLRTQHVSAPNWKISPVLR